MSRIAILAPTDPVAAGAVFRRLGVPRQGSTIVEGESLINDRSALAVYRVAIAAVVTAEERKRIVREFVRRLEETSVGQEVKGASG